MFIRKNIDAFTKALSDQIGRPVMLELDVEPEPEKPIESGDSKRRVERPRLEDVASAEPDEPPTPTVDKAAVADDPLVQEILSRFASADIRRVE
jgi:hypothetical protein